MTAQLTIAVARGYLEAQHAFHRKQALTDGTQFNPVLSASLGLTGPHAYGEKSARAVAVLRETLR